MGFALINGCRIAVPFVVFILAGVCYRPATAEPGGASDLPLIVVSPTGIPTSSGRIGSSVSVVTAADIERDQRRTIAEVLTMLPGLNVVQTGGVGGQTSVFIRGTNSNHVKVLIDGIDVTDPGSANRTFDFAHLPTYDIERIEVLRGPQSGLYGADAVGGVISITTKKGEGPPKVRALVEGGLLQTFNQAAGISGSTERANYAFHYSHLFSGDIPVTPDRFVVPGRPAIGNHYDNSTGSARLGFDASRDLSFKFVARVSDILLRRSDLEFPPPAFAAVAPLQQTRQEHEQAFVRGEAVWKSLGGRLTNRFGAAYSDLITRNIPPSAAPTITRGRREKFDWRGDLLLVPGHTLVLGAESEVEYIRAAALARSNSNRGLFAELQSEFGQRLFTVLNMRNDFNEQFGSHSTWRAAIAYIVSGSETKLKASYGTGFKAPSLSQLYQDFPPFFSANPNLRPETSRGYDAGFEQPLLGGRIRFGATYFRNDIEDLINCNTFCTTVINIGEARITGVENFVTWSVTDRLRLRADYTYMIARNTSTGALLQRRPKDKYSVHLQWEPSERLMLSASWLFVGSRVDVDRAFVDPAPISPSYSVVNLAANYSFSPHFTMFGRIDNLFDARYEDPHGFLRPGFAAYAGLRFSN